MTLKGSKTPDIPTGRGSPSAPTDLRNNSFNAIRLGAALAVLLSHSFPLGGDPSEEPIWAIARQGNDATIGHLAVIVFFAISGFLITRSYDRSRSVYRFLLARALRLFPGLITCVVLLAGVIGPLLTTESLASYVRSPETASFVAHSLSFVGWSDHLAGVFAGNPFPHSVDGSLWTLRYEFICYVGVVVLGGVGMLRREVLAAMIIAMIIAIHRMFGGAYMTLGLPFAVGAFLYLADTKMRASIGFICILACLLSIVFRGYDIIIGTCGAYATVGFGSHSYRNLPDPAKSIGDLSYGVYVWAFPCEQIAAEMLGSQVSWWAVCLISLPPTAVMAYLSWHLVESRFLALKPRRSAEPLAIG